MESLCNFSCCFDVKTDILSFITCLRHDLQAEASGKDSSEENTKWKDDKPSPDVRIVGQERFNEVLYVWDDVSSFSNEAVTHVGLYDPAKQKNSVLFVHEKTLNIVSCTMNQERSMIAYVTLEGATTGDSTNDSQKQKSANAKLSPFVVYRAFLAEIFPQHRIFDLNVERQNLLRVQFLWNRQPKDRDAASRESKLLFLLHKESIGLYVLPLARMGNKGVMMSGPPETLQVLKQFIWAQWDVVNQRLFVVLMKMRPGEEKPVPIMRCLEFNSKTSSITKILELVLPFPVKLSTGQENYSNVTPSRTMSGSSFNMEVIVQASGSFCVCYQHPTKPKVQTPPMHTSHLKIPTGRRTEPGSTDSETDSFADSTEKLSSPSPRPTTTDSLDPPNPDLRRRAISDISGVSNSPLSQSYVQVYLGGTGDLEISSDLSSPDSSSTASPHPLRLDIYRTSHYGTRSPIHSPQMPATALSSPLMWAERELPSPIPAVEKQDLVDLNYSVLILHHMTVLHCSVPQIPRLMAESTKLYFSCLESYILVYSPGHLLHLLNVSPEVIPCLHVAFHGLSVPISPVIECDEGGLAFWDGGQGGQLLTHFNRERAVSMSGDCIFNAATGKAFRVSINKDAIPSLLVQANCHSTKLALVHLITVHLRDSVLIQKVMKELSMDVTNLDLSELMAEHLIGATFSAIRRQFDRDTLRLLQFTNTDIARGQLVETTDGERLVSFRHASYSIQPHINIHKRDWMERRLTMEVSSSTLWETLEQRVRAHSLSPSPSTVGKPLQRFHPRTIEMDARKQRAQSVIEGGLMRQGPSTQRASFLKKMAASARRVMTPSKKPVITMQPQRDASLVLMEEDALSRPDSSQDAILSLTQDRLIAHFARHLPSSVSQEKILNMAQEYLTCQLQQVRQLVLLMLHACGYPDPRTIPRSTVRLNKRPPPMGYQLFHLIERFYMAVQIISFPLPPGFQTFFTIQGFCCLEPAMFLQYVDHGILRLTEEFMTRLMQEVPDDTEDQVNMKIQILARLPKGTAQVLQHWNHPISMQHLAQQYVADTLREEGVRVSDYRTRQSRSASQLSQSSSNSEGNFSVASTFPPLSTLLGLLEARDPKVGPTVKSSEDVAPSLHHLDPKLVEKVALRHSVEQYGTDLSAVSF
ncbi:uncharacterized protein LOC110989438 [Acanthaster planci]|uniref:Uncharacterized protein LOC110989438 n=1 Tax=Acanthaster planci TaxID=133434 RepID=A0A8B8A0Z2_ACAPL|nr:uncharacterized protein LOC110989438 [Acanthaster planci]